MKIEIASLVPHRWNDTGGIRVMLLTLILMGGILILNSFYAVTSERAFLLSALFAILAIYWVPPLPKVRYIEWIVSNSILLFGLFLFLFKIPYLFSSLISYRSAQIVCVLVYCISCGLLMRLTKEIS